MTERQYMKMDILEDMRERIGCDYIPDLLFRQWEVCRALKTFPLYQYSCEQREELFRYVFNMDYENFLEKYGPE